jgi:hypothetical protein
MPTTPIPPSSGQVPLTWTSLAAFWGYFGPDGYALAQAQVGTDPHNWLRGASGEVVGAIARVRVSDGRLLVAAVCSNGTDQGEGPWRASFILDDLYLVHRGFWSQEEARRDAEGTLVGYLEQQGLVPSASSEAVFDQPWRPVEEILAMLAVILDEGWQAAHVSEYPERWIAICINDARTALLDLSFTCDFRELGPQEPLEHSWRYRLDQPPTAPSGTCSLPISAEIKRRVALHLLERQVPFTMEPLTARLYRVTVSAGFLGLLQEKLAEHAASWLVDEDGELAWFRYRGALISYTRAEQGYTSEWHYRYEAEEEMSGPLEFDVRDLSTLAAHRQDHRAAIVAAIDSGELHPDAPFLAEPSFEESELC